LNQLQTPKTLAGILQISESTVLRMAYSGDLPYIQLRSGKRKKIIRFDPVQVEQWLKKRSPLKAETTKEFSAPRRNHSGLIQSS
jgi:hypothetical protein